MHVRLLSKAAALAVAASLSACAGNQNAAAVPSAPRGAASLRHNTGPAGVIKHVLIVVQENRTPDNLFQGLTGADIATSGKNSKGETVKLHKVKLEAPYDMNHSHPSQVIEWDGGKMDGFDLDTEMGQCQNASTCAYGYVPRSENAPYRLMAEQYAFADRMFETNMGPSFPAHQYLISGTSTIADGSKYKAADNPFENGQPNPGGCNVRSDALVDTIDPRGNEGNPVYPCFERQTLGDLLDAKGVSWHYYQYRRSPGLWHAYDVIQHIYDGPDHSNVFTPSEVVINHINGGLLPSVAWSTPSGADSDHAGGRKSGGPAWVASIVNAMGQSQYWNDCAIFILWDDPGGWYDHVAPQQFNSYELGFRVPLIVVSPYVKNGYVSHTQYEFGSVLKFVEEAFGTGSLGTTDVRANSLNDMFNFNQPAHRFVKIKAPAWHPDGSVPDTD